MNFEVSLTSLTHWGRKYYILNLARKKMNKMKNWKLHAVVVQILVYDLILYYTLISDTFIIGKIFRSIFMVNIMNKYQSEIFVLLLGHEMFTELLIFLFPKDSSNQSSFIAVW